MRLNLLEKGIRPDNSVLYKHITNNSATNIEEKDFNNIIEKLVENESLRVRSTTFGNS